MPWKSLLVKSAAFLNCSETVQKWILLGERGLFFSFCKPLAKSADLFILSPSVSKTQTACDWVCEVCPWLGWHFITAHCCLLSE